MFSKSLASRSRPAAVPADRRGELPAKGERPPRRGQGWQDELTWVQLTFRARRIREELFDADLFAEPAWDIVLELYGAHLQGRRTSVGDACVASSVPSATALRCIDLLVKRGLLIRSRNEEDGGSDYVELAEPAKASMQAMFRKLRALADDTARDG